MAISGISISGPKKPELVGAFLLMGFDCRGETGTFTLHPLTSGNLTVKRQFDVGTWNNAVMAFMKSNAWSMGRASRQR